MLTLSFQTNNPNYSPKGWKLQQQPDGKVVNIDVGIGAAFRDADGDGIVEVELFDLSDNLLCTYKAVMPDPNGKIALTATPVEGTPETVELAVKDKAVFDNLPFNVNVVRYSNDSALGNVVALNLGIIRT